MDGSTPSERRAHALLGAPLRLSQAPHCGLQAIHSLISTPLSLGQAFEGGLGAPLGLGQTTHFCSQFLDDARQCEEILAQDQAAQFRLSFRMPSQEVNQAFKVPYRESHSLFLPG